MNAWLKATPWGRGTGVLIVYTLTVMNARWHLAVTSLLIASSFHPRTGRAQFKPTGVDPGPAAQPRFAVVSPIDIPEGTTELITRTGTIRAEANHASIGTGCRGYGSLEPTHTLVVHGAPRVLRVAARSAEDTTIAVMTPGGAMCDDDSAGSNNPGVDVTLGEGSYPVWVGLFRQGRDVAYELGVRANPEGAISSAWQAGGASAAVAANASAGSRMCGHTYANREVCIDSTSDRTNAGCRGGRSPCVLRAPLAPDPTLHTFSVNAGQDPVVVESLHITEASSGSVCDDGYIPQRPDFRFVVAASANPFTFLRFHVAPTDESSADTVLLINTPDGRWVCNDDSFGSRNPTLDFERPALGQYDVWVGTYNAPSGPAAAPGGRGRRPGRTRAAPGVPATLSVTTSRANP